MAIGSGGGFALAAAKAMVLYEKDPAVVAKKALEIAANICIYTNHNIVIESL